MKTLHSSLLKEILVTVGTTVGLLTFVLVIGNVFTRIFDLLINHDVPFRYVGEFVALLIPWSMIFTLPWALLTAILLVFGRMSADSELVAIRASGISLATFSAPVLLLAVVFTIVCLLINLYIAPWAHYRMKNMVYTLASEVPMSLFTDDAVIDQFPGQRIYVGKKLSADEVENLHVWELDPDGRPVRSLRAQRARITADPIDRAIILTLFDARIETRDASDSLNYALINPGHRAEEMPVRIPLDALQAEIQKDVKESSRSIDELVSIVMETDKRAPKNWAPTLTEIQKRVAASMSCLTFALIAIPLGIRSHRKETFVGVFLSFVVVFLYYSLIGVADTFKTHAAVFPEIIIWVPNILFQVIGLIAFVRVCRA